MGPLPNINKVFSLVIQQKRYLTSTNILTKTKILFHFVDTNHIHRDNKIKVIRSKLEEEIIGVDRIKKEVEKCSTIKENSAPLVTK